MKIRFLEDFSGVKHTNICCFSGMFTPVEVNFQKGSVVEVHKVVRGPKTKDGRKCSLLFAPEKLHPDTVYDVPESCFSVEEDQCIKSQRGVTVVK